MKLIYVEVPVIEKIKRAYVVKDEEDLVNQLHKDCITFDKEAKWSSKPEKMPNGKDLKFTEMNENWK